jgi:hypothetical protein
MTTRVIIVAILALCAADGFAQLSAPKYSNEFLTIGVGARALGMSNAQVALTDDVYSGYWNPAGLLSIESDLQVSAMHAEYFAGVAKYDYGSIGKALDSTSAAAISIIRFGVDDIPNTTELIDAEGNINYDRITSFSAADYAFILSYARLLKPNLRIGGNAKVIYRKVGDFASAIGFGLDASAQFSLDKWKFGVLARDVTSTFNAWSFNLDDRTKEVFLLTGNEIPENSVEVTLPRIILGVARSFEFKNVVLNAEVDFDLTTDGKRNVLVSADPVSVDPHLGLEAAYKGILYLRAGVGNIQKSTNDLEEVVFTVQPNLGVGLRIKQLSLDYALTDIGDQSVALYSNIFSLRFDIYK